ncbi:hypothetical protein SNK03_000525 [Fusarium graminearum]
MILLLTPATSQTRTKLHLHLQRTIVDDNNIAAVAFPKDLRRLIEALQRHLVLQRRAPREKSTIADAARALHRDPALKNRLVLALLARHLVDQTLEA